MARRKSDSPQKAAMREMMQGYLKENDISIKSGNDVNSIMRDMMSVLLEGALDEELNEELGYSKYDYRNKETDNSRNGHSKKTMRTSYGDMDIAIPRDRKGVYEPQLIPKYQNTVTQDMEEKIISMYAKGMTTGDIEAHLKELYDLDISDSTISRITDKIMPLVMAQTECKYLLLYFFECQLMIIPHTQEFFCFFILCSWDMNRAVVMLCKTFGNDFSITFVCFDTLFTTLLKHCSCCLAD